jgi:hypothetical protein
MSPSWRRAIAYERAITLAKGESDRCERALAGGDRSNARHKKKG